MRLNSASLSAIGNSRPSHNAQPAGAKLKPTRMISPRCGCMANQFCDGKTPCSAIQKVNARDGCTLACGWLPPLAAVTPSIAIAPLFIFASGNASLYVAVTPAASIDGTFPTGVCLSPALFLHLAVTVSPLALVA